MNILILMSGKSEAFKDAGYIYPKNLIEVASKPLIQHVIEALTPLKEFAAKFISVIRQDESRKHYTGKVLKIINPEIKVLEIVRETSGAACSALLAVDYINNDLPLIVTNGDQILLETDISEIVKKFIEMEWDAGVVVFEDVHPRWSYVKCDKNNMVIEAAEKRPISKHATAGFYYFKKGKDFVAATMEMINKDAHYNGLFYICPTLNEMILRNAKIGIHQIDRAKYRSLATPNDVQKYSSNLS
jgi:dTDP-glucose pyrophosphorylase